MEAVHFVSHWTPKIAFPFDMNIALSHYVSPKGIKQVKQVTSQLICSPDVPLPVWLYFHCWFHLVVGAWRHTFSATPTIRLQMTTGLPPMDWLVSWIDWVSCMISSELSHLLSSLSGGRSAKPQLKNEIFGQSYRFGSSLYHFTVYIYIYILVAPFASPCKMDGGILFTPSLQQLQRLWLPYAFFCSAPTVVWYDTCQCNCKSQLHRPVSSSETSFEFSLLEEARMSSHSDMLQAFHWPASA